MGFLSLFSPKAVPPTVPSILPEPARRQILQGHMPTLKPHNLILKKGEVCHFVDRAIYEKRTVSKRRIRKNVGYSAPGLFKGTRLHVTGDDSEYVDDVKYATVKGILYITTKRIIFVGGADGFEHKTEELVAVTPFANCVELRFSRETLKLFVPDGNLPYIVLQSIC